ncbi:MAG: CotH kinase family protein, partial [Bacteroidota bacterium]|nr:CotH kinase family protein [Bacteroidota bacterium]
YIQGFINDMEKELKKIGTSQESHYADYLDLENFAEYWMVLESITNYEAYKPRSVKMYKGRDGVDSPKGTVCKLKAGPLWDQELFLVDHTFNTKDAHYFKYLFKDPAFVAAVKEHWKTYKSNLLGNGRYNSFVDYLNDIVALIDGSAQRDLQFWGNDYFTFEEEVATVRNGFVSKINWMDNKINAF